MRTTLLTCLGLAFGLWASSAPANAQAITTTRIASGFSSSLYACSPPGDTDRLFVVQRGGQIRIIENLQTAPTVRSTPFLTVTGLTSGGEQGLLGLAFHPDYATNGRFFVNYTASGGGATRIVEYGVSTADPNLANPSAVQTLLSIAQPFGNHNGGCIQFGPDGFLYIGTGDGGSGGDPGDRAQNRTNLLGKMLRLDVDVASPFIPASNPFVGVSTTADEIWATGIRNPWRFSFDSLTGDMYMADVGQNAWEEVNFQPAASTGGENYGWRCMEGNNCFTTSSLCTCNSPALTDPFQVYSHSVGFSITGGYVYRGSAIPSLDGSYFYADFGTSRIWSLRYDGTTVTDFMDRTVELRPMSGSISSIASFAEDANGEMYIVELGGEIWKIVPDCDTATFCQAVPNSTGSVGMLFSSGSLSVADNNFGLVAANLPFGQFTYFVAGTAETFIANPGGSNGNLCVGGTNARFNRAGEIGVPDFLGTFSLNLDLTDFPANPTTAVMAGETWYFQAWHRENGGQSNFTQGLSALFCP